MELKSWLRAIPTHVTKWHIQACFDEFCFRINRSQFKNSIFHKTIERMVLAKPIYQENIKQTLIKALILCKIELMRFLPRCSAGKTASENFG